MKYSDFSSSLAQKLSEPLAAIGFDKLADDLFVRFKGSHEINVISIQKHSSESTVCVNFGVHYDFLPKIGSTELPSAGSIELPDCEVKVRLTPDTSVSDYWWPVAIDAIEEMSELICSRSDAFFSSYDIGVISAIVPDDLSESVPETIKMLTKVRACLILARVNEVFGDTEKAADFAKLGIKAAGMAVGPKKQLKEVLKRVEVA